MPEGRSAGEPGEDPVGDGDGPAFVGVPVVDPTAVDCDGAAYNEALENLGEVDTGDLTGEMILSPDRHRAADGGRVYNWDADEGRAVPVTDWILTGFAG